MNCNTILQNTINNIDEIKDQLGSEIYLRISNDLQKLYNSIENNFYKITYVTTSYTKTTMNSYVSILKKREEIIILSPDEYVELNKNINNSNGFAKVCCNVILSGIGERLGYTRYHELIGFFQDNSEDIGDIDDPLFELTINSSIAFLSVKKL